MTSLVVLWLRGVCVCVCVCPVVKGCVCVCVCVCDFPRSPVVKTSAPNAGSTGSILVGELSGN